MKGRTDRMKNENKFSIISNMSLGFVPMIITMILSEFTTADIAVYIGAATGIFAYIAYYFIHKPQTIHFVLLSTTVILSIFSIIALVMGENNWPQNLLPITLEVTVLIPLLILFLNKKRYSTISYKNGKAKDMKERIRTTTLTLSCIRTFFALTTVHFAFITAGILITRSLDNGFMSFMLHIAPIIILIISIVIGQIEINILQTVKPPEFVPVVTPQGEVIGKVDKDLTAEEYKNTHTHPIIRIAVVSHNMLFLSKRSDQRVIDKEKIDIPLEAYLLFKENINSGVERLLKEVFPNDWKGLKPEFSIKYSFKNEDTNRLVYLFILDLGTDDKILCDPQFDSGKLWTFQQIEYNLDHNYFSEMFENEYDHLKMIIETREIYKES